LTVLDFIILGIFLIGFILGYKDGFIRKIIGFLGFVLAIFLSAILYIKFGSLIESVLGIEIYLAKIIAGVSIFIGVMFVFAVIKRVVHPFDKVNNLINQIMGGAIGANQILFFLSAVFFLLNVFDVPGKKTSESSLFYSKVYSILPLTIDYLDNYTPKTKEILQDYINEKDTLK